MLGYGVLFIIAFILLAIWPARVASRKGYNFLLFFILSWFLFPIMLVIAYVLPDKGGPSEPMPA